MRIPTIGLEIHAELKTKTKMFCGCRNDAGETKPNVNVCPVCLAHPGTLPVANKAAILSVIELGLAVGGKIAEHSHFDRKSYFYPDLPKAYQITQYEEPFVAGGMLKDIRIRRVHLEEDTGRLLHTEKDGKSATLVDYNRAGVPLMELVTEPDVKNAEEAVAFAKELQLILRYLGISEADMEKGQMRVEANISLDMGTKVEVKNINSFRAVYGAIEYEIKRQNGVLDEGGKIHQETRGWDDQNNRTVSQRSKESAHDYRYFPEPDLPPLELTPQGGFDVEDLKRHLPELPEEKRQRLVEEFGFGRDQVDILVGDRAAADYFEAAASELKGDDPKASYQLLLNYFTSDLKGLMNEKKTEIKDLKITPEHLANLVVLVSEGKLSSRLAKDILLKMFEIGDEPGTIMKASGVALMSDEGDLLKVIEEIIAKNPKPVEDYKKGKTNALQFLFGQAMAKTKGQAKPDVLRRILTEKLDA